jgi:hypothetical protein
MVPKTSQVMSITVLRLGSGDGLVLHKPSNYLITESNPFFADAESQFPYLASSTLGAFCVETASNRGHPNSPFFSNSHAVDMSSGHPTTTVHTNVPSEHGLKASLHSVLHYLDTPIHNIARAHSPVPQHHDINIVPKFNVVETAKAYFLEGEFPGVKDKNHIVLEKAGPRTLKISADIALTDPKEEWGTAYDVEAVQPTASEEGHGKLSPDTVNLHISEY